jgi:hypothetical protein
MLFLKILLKYIYLTIILFLNRLLRFSNSTKPDVMILNDLGVFRSFSMRVLTPVLRKLIKKFLPVKSLRNKFLTLSNEIKIGTITQNNRYLLRLLSLNLKTNFCENSEDVILKKFNFSESFAREGRSMGQSSYRSNMSLNGGFLYKSVENVAVTNSTNVVFDRQKIGYSRSMENVFVHQSSNSVDYLTKDSATGINFNALEDLYNYLRLFGDDARLRKYPADSAYKATRKIRKKNRVPKNFRGGRLLKKRLLPHSTVTEEMLRKDVNTLKQIEYILKNRELFEKKDFRVRDLKFTDEVKRVMFSSYNPVGAYGKDSVMYTGDMASRNRVIVGRRINLTQQNTFVGDLSSFNLNVGFFNFDTEADEEWENSNSSAAESGIIGESFFINPFVVLGFLCYSIIELLVLFYLMSFFFSNPYDTFRFFFKYPSVYFYENLTGFPSPNYFFFAVSFWIAVIVIFCVHILELIDEDNFEPPNLSWVYGFISDFLYNFLILGCLFFCVFELFNFVDLLISRVFFIGVPGYPNLVSILFLLFYDIFYLLGTSSYFSFYLEHFLHLEVKFPALYFSEYTPLVQRYPLVQPYFLGNPYLDRPNFFLWLVDGFLNYFSGEAKKKVFFTNDLRFVFQRELIQDIRKYNYIRSNLQDLRFLGQLHARGWNGFNYRLDLQMCVDPILPSEQVMRFDWRLKSSHSSGLHSRLFKGLPFGASTSSNMATKKVFMTKGPRMSSRYGYLQYLTRINRIKKRGGDGGGWYHSAPRSIRKRLWLAKLTPGDRKTTPTKRRHKSFLFSPGRAKFRLMLNEPRRVRTKAERNFKQSRIFRNFWSYMPGNDKPRRYFRRKPFVSIQDFSRIPVINYAQSRVLIDKSFVGRTRSKLPKIGKYALRNLYLTKPEFLFPTDYINQRSPLFNLKTQNDQEDLRNSRKLSLDTLSTRPERSFSTGGSTDSNFFMDNSPSRKLRLHNKEIVSPGLLHEKERKYKFKHRFPRTIKKRRISISKIPNFPFKHSTRHKFISRVFSNFEPKYFLKHTASFTTFSKVDEFTFQGQKFVSLFGGSYPLSVSSGLSYPFGLVFLGFGKFVSSISPLKVLGFDYYYSQNHNFFFALFDNYFKKGQLRTIPTSVARFNHPLKGGLRFGWDFLYPMISELRLTEKILPIDFLYSGRSQLNYRHLRLDPYEAIRNSRFAKGPCYFLDARIQNWLNFTNVIWNDYFHFFFNRSYKTEGSGSKFVLTSYNPIRGPASYKLFISSPTLEIPRVGQFFYNYIPWLQYKFKWLLYPTSTYKRFDSFRFIHQHSNKKFYFTSLLKFYQMNLFRWQQSAQIFQWNQLQSRNFLLHLFFHKYNLLAELSNLRTFFATRNVQSVTPSEQSIFNFRPELKIDSVAPAVDRFNSLFFRFRSQQIASGGVDTSLFSISEIYVPSFTLNDFRFFQYVVDLRRWKALQAPYIRDWKFERYVRYLGPLLYREDVASLMGFFAPFEYRNQIFVSRLRNDALRFSVFFPKKVIDEKFVNPLKRLNVPSWVPRSHKERLRSSGGSFYAFIINRPFLLYSPNYSVFANKGKKVLSGLYPHFQRLNLELDLNFLYGQGTGGGMFDYGNKTFGDILYGEELFSELNSKKKRLLYDKVFWLSKSYELQNLSKRLIEKTVSPNVEANSKSLNQVMLSQLGKPLDLVIPKVVARTDSFEKFKLGLTDFNTPGSKVAAKIIDRELLKHDMFLQRICPDIYVRAGGPKISSRQWHMGQSWMKFVVASQNVSVAPISSDSELNKFFSEDKVSSSLNDIISPIWRTERLGYSGLPSQTRFVMSLDTRPKHGYFNFGLSGIGRLPRLSRSFFHMLFFRNKLDDFKRLKIAFLKLYLMSIPLFNKSDFFTNASFKLFWLFVLGLNDSTVSMFPLRHSFLFNNIFRQYQVNPEFSSLIHLPELGTIVSLYSREYLTSSNILILHNQYGKFKAYQKYKFFVSLHGFKLHDHFHLYPDAVVAHKLIIKNKNSQSLFNQILVPVTYLPRYYIFESIKFFNRLLTNLSFDFFNYVFMRSYVFRDSNANAVVYINKHDKELGQFGILYKTIFPNLSSIFLEGGLFNKAAVHDFFRERLYFGSFRSTLHWYIYPVHSFFFVRDYLSLTANEYICKYLKLSFGINFKYWRSLISPFGTSFSQNQNKFFELHLRASDNAIQNEFAVRHESDFLQSFVKMCSRAAFSSDSMSFFVQTLFRFREPIVLRVLFCFRSMDSQLVKFSNTFSAFFFSTDFLRFSQTLNSTIFLPIPRFSDGSGFQLSFTDNFDRFSVNLFKNTMSIDGSGKHNRPKSVSQTLDNIFTYREYEKYRKEHHRQRFRSISPYWLQNSFRNRAHYVYGYKSPENKKRRQTHTALVMMLKRVSKLDRYKLHPVHGNRISFFGSLNPEKLVSGLMNNNLSLSAVSKSENKNSDINFVDVAGEKSKALNFHKKRFFRVVNSYNATRHASLESIRRSKRKKRKIFTKILERHFALLPERRFDNVSVPSYEHRFFKTPTRAFPAFSFSEYTLFAASEEEIKQTKEAHTHATVTLSKVPDTLNTHSQVPLGGSPTKAKMVYQKNGRFFNQLSSQMRSKQSLDALKLLEYPYGFYSDGGNFINVKKPPARNDLFQTPGFKNPVFFESVENLDLFYELMLESQRKAKGKNRSLSSTKEFLDERRKSQSPRSEGGSASVRQRAGVDAFNEISPRYLRVPKPRRKIAGLHRDIIGGAPSTARRNRASYPGIMVRRTTQRGISRGPALGPKRYPANVKRFVRSKARVLMYIPYLYSKWFTQNPRLSAAVNTELLNIFINNQFDEFNYICVQSLLLLKRKIMFNIINLKLISYKQKILYFSPLSSITEYKYEHLSIFNGWVEPIITGSVKYLLKIQWSLLNEMSWQLILEYLYAIRGVLISIFFKNDLRYLRLLYNPLVSRFTHDSLISSDMLFFEDFYYKQTAKRILSQIAFLGHSAGGWHNPTGLAGQYTPGLNFYAKGSVFFNFGYQHSDLFSNRYFSPEILLDNNLKRQSSSFFDRNFFFNEFFVSPNYKRAWHFLAFRIAAPLSPYIEYDRLHNFQAYMPSSSVRHMHHRLPLMSFRRVYNIFPNHLKGFFSTLVTDSSVLIGHDVTLPLKLKLLNYNLRADALYRRQLDQFFKSNASQIRSRVLLFSQALKSKQLSVLTEFHNRLNLASLVNKRRLGFRRNVWSPFRYNVYYRFNWRTFLHRFSSEDEIGFRRYKLSPFFDINQGSSVPSLKSRALQHLIISQIPRFELDARRRVPLNMSPREFNLLLFFYFKYVNDNFSDKGYNRLDSKIFKYVNRKVHPFLSTFILDRNPHFQIFWPQYRQKIKDKTTLNEKTFDFEFRGRSSKRLKKLPKYTLSGKLEEQLMNQRAKSKKVKLTKPLNAFGSKRPKRLVVLKRFFIKGSHFLSKEVTYFIQRAVGPEFLKLFHNRSVNVLLNRKLSYDFKSSSNLHFAAFVDASVRMAGLDRFWLHEFYDSLPSIYRFLDKYFLVNFNTYMNIWYRWFRPFYIRSTRFLFLMDRWGRFAGHGRRHKHNIPSPMYRYFQYGFSYEWLYPKISVSRIFGIHKLFLAQRHRERLLNPASWLSFDLFSRVRPAFRPFLHKFSKHFMFSKIIPARGIPSYNAFIKSHTKFDNYFERHPYIAFSIGMRAHNNLINVEGAYKEVRMRSQMLDFARRHYRNASPVNFRTRKHSFYDYSLFRKNRYLSKRKARIKRSVRAYQEMNKLFPFFTRHESQFFNSRVRSISMAPPTGARFGDWSSAETLLETYDLNYPLRSRRRRFRYLPMRFVYSRGFFKDANFFSVMPRPRRSVKLLNILISRPYTASVKFLRSDNYSHWLSGDFLSKFLLKYGTFNPTNFERISAYYQPNLKIFFDFNAYKQRYNLGLLFRGLSFERDFQFFLLQKAKFFEYIDETERFSGFRSDIDLLANFTNLTVFDYFEFLIPKLVVMKGYINESRLSTLYWTLDRLVSKLNPFYILLVLVDFYLTVLFSLFSLFLFLSKFDFSIFINLFDINDNIVYYVKKRPIFQIFFHIAIFREYLKFSWLFSLKFLIFNIDYYPYYFLMFAILLIMRRLSLNVQRQSMQAPFVVPHVWRFSDLQFNFHSGWFDRAWSEIKWEAVHRLNELHTANSIKLDHEQLLSFDDVKRFKRKYKFKGKSKFFETGDDDSKKIDLSKFDNADPNDLMFSEPITEFRLKGWFSRLSAISFLPPSVDSRISDSMQFGDSRKDLPFRKYDIVRQTKESNPNDPNTKKNRNKTPDPEAMDSTVISKKFDLRSKPKFSFFLFRKQFGLLLRGRLTFSKFVSDFRVGSKRDSDRNVFVGNYDVDDFGEEFYRLFLDPMAEFNFFINQDLKHRRMLPDDENIHFYRKPGSVLQNEIMLQKYGTESDQLHYIIEFPGRFNRTYINAFSRAYAVRNLSYNQPQYGFFSFPRNAKLPTTFEEFIIFCSQSDTATSQDGLIENTTTPKPEDTSLNPNLVRLRELWTLFQYVTKYEYNMLNEHNMDDTRIVSLLLEDRPFLFDNIKFWVNKASVDAVNFNFTVPSFFALNATVDDEELVMKGSDPADRLVNLDIYKGEENSAIGTVSPLMSVLYMFYVYLFLFIFFLFVSFVFCVIFVFIYSLWNYVAFILW